MSVLQSQPPLCISTNECKQQFLDNEINQMKVTKDIYLGILDELRQILKQALSMVTNDQKIVQSNLNESDSSQFSSSVSLSMQQSCQLVQLKKNNKENKSKYTNKINNRIKQFTSSLEQRVKSYCSSEISQNIIKYLAIQNEQRQFYPLLGNSLNSQIKNHQIAITQRQKQLQQIEDIKYTILHHQTKKQISKSASNKFCNQKDKKSTQKAIQSIDFNQKLIQMFKKQINLLKLKKRRLQIQAQEKRKIKQNTFTRPQTSQNIKIKHLEQSIHESTAAGLSERLNQKKLSGLKKYDFQKQSLKQNQNSKNGNSAFEKIVMVYQKDKFLNILMEQKISKLKKQLLSQRMKNNLMEEKTNRLQKEIEKLDWNKVCDQSFVPVQNKKLDKPLQLSIMDRTFFKPCDEQSVEYSQMSINQSVIQKF